MSEGGTAATLETARNVPRRRAGRLLRFTRTERAAHWVQATSYLVLLISGFALSLPALEGIFGHRNVVREVHLSAAFFLFFGPAIVALAGDRKSVGRDVEEVETWDADDLRWLRHPLRTPQGRFNAGQKLNAIFIAWSTLTFSLTGLILWQNRRFPLDVVQRANVIHTDLAYIALAAFLGHLYLAAIHPPTRHSLRAITQGWVQADWAQRHHPKWIAPLEPAGTVAPRDAARAALQIFLGSMVALFAVRLLFFWLGANVTDPVTTWLYDVTAWPGIASIVPQTGVRIVDWPAVVYLAIVAVAWWAADQMRRSEIFSIPTAP